MVALPPGHRLARQRRLTLRKLAHEPFVMLKRSSAALLHDWVSNLCREAGFEVQIVKLADGPTSILELVSAGFGVALVPGVFQRFPSDVVFRPLPPTTPKLHLALSWRRDNESPLPGPPFARRPFFSWTSRPRAWMKKISGSSWKLWTG